MPPRLALRNISKAYPAVRANDAVDLTVEPGEIHAILGENGAGKSTLMKIIYGVVRPDEGTVHWDGQEVRIANPAAARALGLGMVFQHFSLFDTLTVAENIALGLPPDTDMRALETRIAATAAQYGLDVEPRRHVHTLSVGERQRVEIVRALLGKPRLLILDEPTSVLTPQAVLRLFEVLRQLAAEGCSILYISHKLDEIRALCHRCTVMRAGRVTGVCDPRQETEASLSRLMIGADLPVHEHRVRAAGPVLLRLRGLDLPRAHPFATPLAGIDLDLHAGEILGVAGVSGNGQQELMGALSGEDRRAARDSILFDGQPVGHRSSAWRRMRGMAFVPEERLGRGAVPELSLARNLLLSHQGPDTVPVEFIALRAGGRDLGRQHPRLVANALAQARALMMGRPHERDGHRRFTGNRPSTFLLLERLDPASLGALIALYEHRVFASGALWGINSFDQWGVELGKTIARDLEPRLATGDAQGLDASTAGLLRRLAPMA